MTRTQGSALLLAAVFMLGVIAGWILAGLAGRGMAPRAFDLRPTMAEANSPPKGLA